jgi:hypothetical protein
MRISTPDIYRCDGCATETDKPYNWRVLMTSEVSHNDGTGAHLQRVEEMCPNCWTKMLAAVRQS